MAGSRRVARSINVSERGIGDEGELGGVSNHLVVSTGLFGSGGQLVPDVHPVTILTIDALSTDLDLNLGNKLLAGAVQPTGIDSGGSSSVRRHSHHLVDLRESDLEVGAVSKITISADRALHTASKIGLSIESLLNGFNGEISVTSVGHLPKSDLRISCTIPLPYLSIRIRLYLKKNLYLLSFQQILYLT